MDVLLIESKLDRRVALARALMQSGHRVTLSSSVEEAGELLSFIEQGEPHPDVVVIAETLLGRPADELREEVDCKSSSTAWLPLRANADAAFLEHWLHKTASFRSRPGGRPAMLVVEASERRRATLARRYRRRGHHVHAVANSAAARTYLLVEAPPGPLALACAVELEDGDGLSLYRAACALRRGVTWDVLAA